MMQVSARKKMLMEQRRKKINEAQKITQCERET